MPNMKKTLADALADRGYDTLTPVQEAVTDEGLGDADLLVSAQTGSGKTVGFGLAIAGTLLGDSDRFERADAPLALVIAPTRELAMQVKRELAWLYAKAGAVVASCVGGMDMRDERRALARGTHIVVATPGRLRDHIMRGSMDMGALRAVILDEADEMLDLGFRDELEYILGEAPDNRRTLMFSATVPRAIETLAKNYQNDAKRIVTTSKNSAHADIAYRAMQVSPHDGENAVINILRYYEAPNALVFCNTRAMVNRMTTRFSNRGLSVVALSGELSQNERSHALQAMRDGRARVCVATDVAARGIDLPNLELVIHADLPSNAETMLHRSGRTGRAGRKGVSALIVPPKMRRKAESLLRAAKVNCDWGDAPTAAEVLEKDQERLLSDATWQQEITETEKTAVEKLTALYGPEQIAAAFLRLHADRLSAPEELSKPNAGAPPKPRAEFGPSVWFSIAGGKAADAVPGRILPMLCKAGNITKEDIGAIRIQQDQSYVEISKSSLAGFLAAIGDNLRVEGNEMTQLDKPPAAANSPRQGFAARQRDQKRQGDKSSHKPEFTKPEKYKKHEKHENRGNNSPIDYDDAPEPRRKKPKGGFKKPSAGRALTPQEERNKGAVTAKSPHRKPAGKKPTHAKKPGGKHATPVGKPSSKKNRARAKAVAQLKTQNAKGGRKSPRDQ